MFCVSAFFTLVLLYGVAAQDALCDELGGTYCAGEGSLMEMINLHYIEDEEAPTCDINLNTCLEGCANLEEDEFTSCEESCGTSFEECVDFEEAEEESTGEEETEEVEEEINVYACGEEIEIDVGGEDIISVYDPNVGYHDLTYEKQSHDNTQVLIKVDGLQKYISIPGEDEVKDVMVEIVAANENEATIIAYCDERESVANSEMNCCQPAEATTAACVVDLEATCPEGYNTMENEWVDPNNGDNCIAHSVGYSTPSCEGLGLEEETEEEVGVSCNMDSECAEGESCVEGFCVAEEEEETVAVE